MARLLRIMVMLLAMLEAAGASAAPCVPTDLGAFRICVPADWRLQRRGIDSLAGRFVGERLVVFFDFGAAADPLHFPDGSTATRESPGAVDGRPARLVGYDLQGLHVSGVHVGSAGPGSALKLTLLAQTEDAARLKAAETAFATVRFKPAMTGPP